MTILNKAMNMPGVRVNRENYLRINLSKYVPDEQVEKAIETTPAKAGIDNQVLKSLAKAAVVFHKRTVSGLSFLSGLPGGPIQFGAIPADLIQFIWHTLVISQKLAYLYGWPQIISMEQSIDDDTLNIMTLFLGVMFGQSLAGEGIRKLSIHMSRQVAVKLPRKALTRYGVYNLTKKVSKYLGIRLTKKSFARVASRFVPIIGGLASGGITWFMFSKMAGRLESHLEQLPLATN
ncbi:MAG: hypothetical protein PF689_03950 [Deltaproteobacteria bacterium]|nr:hypothetical protein [Deltaproteobacteria bacterium]